jgi:hypothetical protein
MKVYRKTDGKCTYCGGDLSPNTFVVDHILPRKQGGGDEFANLAPACPSCNGKKTRWTPEEYKCLLIERAVYALAEYARWIQFLPPESDPDGLRWQVEQMIEAIQQNPPRFYIDQLNNGDSND